MMNKKTITVGALALLTIAILGGIVITDDDVFYCQYRNIAMQCDKLTPYYSLENGKCWNNEIGNKLCKTGWIEVVDNTTINIDLEHEGIKHVYRGREWDCESTDPYAICMRDGTHKSYRFQLNE